MLEDSELENTLDLTKVQPLQERKDLEFKTRLDIKSTKDWCELIKDIVALANSGGGHIVLGLDDDGSPSGEEDLTEWADSDPVTFTQKVSSYTGEERDYVEIQKCICRGKLLVGLKIHPSPTLLIFEKPGTYPTEKGQRTAFGQGTVFFRRGAKSAPATSKDITRFIERVISSTRKDWLGNIRKIVAAPIGATTEVIVDSTKLAKSRAMPVRLVWKGNAKDVPALDINQTHPFRQVDIVRQLNQMKIISRTITSYDIQCLRRWYNTDKKTEMFYKPSFGSGQYSKIFLDWAVKELKKNHSVLESAKAQYKKRAS